MDYGVEFECLLSIRSGIETNITEILLKFI